MFNISDDLEFISKSNIEINIMHRESNSSEIALKYIIEVVI